MTTTLIISGVWRKKDYEFMKGKIKTICLILITFIKNLVLLASLYLVCQFFVVEYFGVSFFDDGGLFYALAATILIAYWYGKRQAK